MNFPLFRDIVTFLGGISLAAYEVLTTPPSAEPSLVVLGMAATMMGLAGSLPFDRILNRGEPEPPAVPPPDEAPPRNDDLARRRRHGR